MTLRTCPACEQSFQPNRDWQKYCSEPCAKRHRQKNWFQANKRHAACQRRGITVTDFDNMLKSQEGRCAVCHSTEPGGRWGTWHIDHDHTSGEVRGLLCHHCNIALQKHWTPDTLRRAAQHLEAHDTRAVI